MPKSKTPYVPPNPTPVPKQPQPADPLQSAILLLTSNLSELEAQAMLEARLRISPDEANTAVLAARGKIDSAAVFERKDVFAQAMIRLTHLYTTSLTAHNTATALAAQKELNRLYGLYDSENAAADDELSANHGVLQGELEAIRAHLLPLELSKTATTTVELVRLAVGRIVSLESLTQKQAG